MLFHSLLSHERVEPAPAGEDARHQTTAYEPLNTQIGSIEVGGVDLFVLRVPGKSGFVGSPGIEREHVGI